MYQNEIEIIKSRIENKHQGDEKQLEIIFIEGNSTDNTWEHIKLKKM